MIKEILREQKTELRLFENTVSTNSSSSYFDDTIIKVKVKKLSSDKENKSPTDVEGNYPNVSHKVNMIQSKSKSIIAQDQYNVKSNVVSYNNIDDKTCLNKSKYKECLKKDFHVEMQSKTKIHDDKVPIREKSTALQSVRPMSAPNILEHQQEYTRSSQTKSTSSTKNTYSGAKSCKFLTFFMYNTNTILFSSFYIL